MASEAKSFEKFALFIAQGGSGKPHDFKDIVGEFHEDEEMVMLDYAAVYNLYGTPLDGDWSPMEITLEDDKGTVIKVTCCGLCAVGALLPLGKLMAHINSWINQIEALPASSEA